MTCLHNNLLLCWYKPISPCMGITLSRPEPLLTLFGLYWYNPNLTMYQYNFPVAYLDIYVQFDRCTGASQLMGLGPGALQAFSGIWDGAADKFENPYLQVKETSISTKSYDN